jgi:ferredoxin like protein
MNIEFDRLVKHVISPIDFITVDKSKCNGCGNCLMICVMNLWKKKEGIAYIVDDYKSKCLECGGCYIVCEPNAIDFRYPAGGTGIVYEQG